MQLDAFLRSYCKHVTPTGAVHVLHAASTPEHASAYSDVFALHAHAVSHPQSAFKQDLLELLLRRGGNVTFFVDDQLFIRPWRVLERPGLSLRLAPHLSRCYPVDAEQPLPQFDRDSELLSWRWSAGQLDWGYPLSLDGHVFDVAEMLTLLSHLQFHSPNSLEAALQQCVPQFAQRCGLCYDESRVVNVPWNMVQTDCVNRHASVAAEWLLEQWRSGLRIAVEEFYGVFNVSAHQELPLMLVAR